MRALSFLVCSCNQQRSGRGETAQLKTFRKIDQPLMASPNGTRGKVKKWMLHFQDESDRLCCEEKDPQMMTKDFQVSVACPAGYILFMWFLSLDISTFGWLV